jgi:hypothetical protein
MKPYPEKIRFLNEDDAKAYSPMVPTFLRRPCTKEYYPDNDSFEDLSQ